MSVPWPAALLLPVLLGVLVGWLSGPVLRRLPEPQVGQRGVSADELATKLPYAALASPRFRSGCAALAAAAGAVVVVAVEPTAWSGWLVLATVGVLAATIDGVTTWLPARITRTGVLLAVLLAPVGLLLGNGVTDLLRVLVGGAAAAALFWVFWRVSRGQLAYGDVRLAPLLGATGGSVSWSMVLLVLLLGTVLGALHGVARGLARRTGPFPYAPGLVAGAFLAPLVAAFAS
ncbi:MAG: prepilin peptidase [Propionibacteriaceae bacterium]